MAKADDKTALVVGFAWDKAGEKLALIQKRKGNWMGGFWNGIGGHVEHFDTSPLDAMVREFSEETGVFIRPDYWRPFCTMVGWDHTISCFTANSDEVLDVSTTTDEVVQLFNKADIPYKDCISNLAWLIPMSQEVWMKHPNTPPSYTITVHEPRPEPIKPKFRWDTTGTPVFNPFGTETIVRYTADLAAARVATQMPDLQPLDINEEEEEDN